MLQAKNKPKISRRRIESERKDKEDDVLKYKPNFTSEDIESNKKV